MQISQIYFSDKDGNPPVFLQGCMQTVKENFPESQHVLFNLEAARHFLTEKFGIEVLTAFDKLKPYAYKADLLKYCILYEIGGWYFDIATRPVSRVEIPDWVDSIAFGDTASISQSTWTCLNAVLYSKSKNPVYQTAINFVLENCKNLYYGKNALCPTGPILLGKAFAFNGDTTSNIFGDYVFLTPLHPNRNPAFVLPDGLIFAIGKPAGGGDLTALGAQGTNNYNDFYNQKDIYSLI